jgi:UDP-N-acetylmuramoyl-tripeptide--D-alanyl-D-alanine ligase
MNTTYLSESFYKTTSILWTENVPAKLKIGGVSIDSRTIQPGEMFIAIRGERFDGHQFIFDALKKGAAVVVVDSKADKFLQDNNYPKIVVDNCLDFLMHLAKWHRSKFSVPIIGITGSTGKTTAKEMIASILSRRFETLKTEGNKNNFIGVSQTLLRMNSSTKVAVVEMGTNHPGEIAKLSDIVRPNYAAITNIGYGHIGNFGSIQAIYKEKISLAEDLQEGGIFYKNIEDPLLKDYHNDKIQIKEFGLNESGNCAAKFLGINRSGNVCFKIQNDTKIQLQIPGKHNLLSAVLGAAIGYDFGISSTEIKSGLETVKPISQRMEYFSQDNILFINDTYNSNPDSLRAAIDFLSELPIQNESKRFLVIGDMLELGELSEKLHQQIGEYLLDKSIDIVFGFGEKTRSVCEMLAENRPKEIHSEWFETYQQIAAAIDVKVKPGDVILLKGSRGMALENVLKYLKKRN